MDLLIVVSCIILNVGPMFVTMSDIDCPQMCNCYDTAPEYSSYSFTGNSTLTVDCGGRGMNETILAQELDLLLSLDQLRENLLWLNISHTPLTQVPTSVCQLSNLIRLYLDNNRLSGLRNNCFTNMKALLWLSANGNNIRQLQDGLFDGLNSLKTLDLEHNMIASVGLHVFSNPHDLVNLTTISLSHNRLRSLDPWPYIRGLHGSRDSKVQISMESNFISKFTNNIGWQFNCSPRSYVTVDIAYNYLQHLLDILDGWNISVDQWFCISNYSYSSDGHMQLRPVFFEVLFRSSLDYHCDCYDILFYTLEKNSDANIFNGVICRQPLSYAGRYVYMVQLEDFVCKLSDRCPANCSCVYRPVNATVHVYCSAANLTSLPVYLPPLPRSHDKYKLDFSNNKLLQRLDHRPYFVNTYVLDVSNCAIESVDLNAWREFAMMPSEIPDVILSLLKHNLTVRAVVPRVLLNGNRIKSLHSNITDINLTSVHLTLNDNPWKCSCDNRWMIALFKSLSSATSTNVGDVLCVSPSRLKGTSILQSEEVDFCVDPSIRMLQLVLSSTLSAVAGLLLLGFAVYRLRVRLYKRWKFHPFDRDECIGEDMDYDVFLCCSSDDNSPYGLRILHLMESKGYSVCYHLRDFLAGGLITDNMLHSVVRSKRTLCFISRNFLQR